MTAATLAGTKDMLIGLAAVAVAGVVLYVIVRGAPGVAQDAARGAVNTVAGAVKGAAEGVGIPDTDKTKCQKALAEGRYWDASFDCPASDFVRGVFGRGSFGEFAPEA